MNKGFQESIIKYRYQFLFIGTKAPQVLVQVGMIIPVQQFLGAPIVLPGSDKKFC